MVVALGSSAIQSARPVVAPGLTAPRYIPEAVGVITTLAILPVVAVVAVLLVLTVMEPPAAVSQLPLIPVAAAAGIAEVRLVLSEGGLLAVRVAMLMTAL